jgi:NAD-dependent deacetylase
MKCLKEYDAEAIFKSSGIPKCDCGGIIRPRVVLYGESLPDDFNIVARVISEADLLIVAGTSLTVEPASSLVKLFNGKNFVIINLDDTPYDRYATLVIHTPLGEVFSKLK